VVAWRAMIARLYVSRTDDRLTHKAVV
jgi:hypothetical protein